MEFPALNELPVTREMVSTFGGYNHNLRIGDGEFYDMTNLSSDDYPVLSPRKKRGLCAVGYEDQPNVAFRGLAAKDSLCFVYGGVLYINGYPTEVGYTAETQLFDSHKSLISMGAYLIVMPDKKYINTAPEPLNDCGAIEKSFTTSATINFMICDGTSYSGNVPRSETPPEYNNDKALWVDTSSKPYTLKRYSSASSQWGEVTPYVRIVSKGIGKSFSAGEWVEISGITADVFKDSNGAREIRESGDDYIMIEGNLGDELTQPSDNPITVGSYMPVMDFVIEAGNRLWGCRYGPARDGTIVNEIYASALGDFRSWNRFAGTSTDSYVASVGTDGPFTGAVTHLGYPIFFKENCMHKVYGNYPANFQIQTTSCRGVQKGCDRSLSVVNEVLYYKSRSGICAYDGSLPVEVSSALGDVQYYNAVAGALGNKYYISMSDAEEDGEYHLFVFDTQKGMWHREDNTEATAFATCRGNLYYIDRDDNSIKAVRGDIRVEDHLWDDDLNIYEDPFEWKAVTGIIGTDSPDKKYISRLDVRMSLEIGTEVMFFVEYDSCGDWEHLFTMTGSRLGSFAVPLRPKRCDHLRLKIVGKGDAKIYSICKTVEQGSDV